jgi:hypothetical protein
MVARGVPNFKSFGLTQDAKVEVLAEDECAAFLEGSQVGRISVSVGALPAIFPVNYLAFDGAVWFRASSISTLFRASVGSVVAFEADGCDDSGAFAWSVLVRGVVDDVSDSHKIEEVKSRFIDAWPLLGAADHYLAIPVTMLTGQRYDQTK